MYVAFARGLSTYDRELSRACQDDVAEALLPSRIGSVLARAREGKLSPAGVAALRQASFGMFDHLALRTRIIDDAVSQAVVSGVRQLVLLGAGLDGRAHRLSQLADTIVFEVDHPSTQRLKQRKAADVPVLAKEIRYTPCDFQRVGLAEALAKTAFDPSQASAWIWEGVTMYLPEVAVEDSLDTIAKLSSSGSRLITTYLEPSVAASGRFFGFFGLQVLGAVAEPIRSHFTRAHFSELLRRRGFVPTTDLRPVSLASRYGINRLPMSLAVPAERVSVADKQRATTRGRE